MSALKLTTAGGLSTSAGLSLVSGVLDETAQRLKIKFRFYLGEWFQNPLIGMPLIEKVFSKPTNLNEIRKLYRQAILGDPAVESLQGPIVFDFDKSARRLSITFSALLNDGSTLTFDDFILAGSA